MERELVVNRYFTSIVESNDSIYDIETGYNRNNEDINYKFQPIVRRRTVKTVDFFRKLSNSLKDQNEVLPNGCKLYKQLSGGKKVIILEEPPRIRSIKVDSGLEQALERLSMTGKLKEYGLENFKIEGPVNFQLSFPYILFIITLGHDNKFHNLRPFFRLHPFTSLSDYLFRAPLYNIPSDQRMCMGGTTSSTNLIESVENVLDNFWNNIFNRDYSTNIELYQKSTQHQVHDYFSWMFYTQMDPMFIYDIKWIKHEQNVFETINSIERGSTTEDCFKIFYQSAFGTTSEKIIYDETVKNDSFSLVIGNDCLSVGDELLFKDKKMYIYSIISNSERLIGVELEDENEDIITVEMYEFEKGYNSIFTKVSIDSIDLNGHVIKPDDVIKFNIEGNTVYKKIKSLRKSRDGRIEAFIGTDHYLLDNIDFDVINLSNVLIYGKELSHNSVYYVSRYLNKNGPVLKVHISKFQEIRIDNYGSIILKFRDQQGDAFSINYSNLDKGGSEYKFLPDIKDNKPNMVYYYDLLLSNKSTSEMDKFSLIKDEGILTPLPGIRPYIVNKNNHTTKNIVDSLLDKNHTRLHIPGVSVDIDFKLGDPIVYANWRNPEDMLFIAVIKEFSVEPNMIFVIAETISDKRILQIPMVDLYNCKINIGAIRKVTSMCNGWKSGDKIKATEVGVPGFPKKDTNSIIAFINDGGDKYPLALCSNLCTLWMNEDTMNKFEWIAYKTARWSKLKISPFNVSSIKWQSGDFHRSKEESIRLTYLHFLTLRSDYSNSPLSSATMSFNSSLDYWYNTITKKRMETERIRHGVLYPRITSTGNDAETKRSFPNMLGGYIETINAQTAFKSDQFKGDF